MKWNMPWPPTFKCIEIPLPIDAANRIATGQCGARHFADAGAERGRLTVAQQREHAGSVDISGGSGTCIRFKEIGRLLNVG